MPPLPPEKEKFKVWPCFSLCPPIIFYSSRNLIRQPSINHPTSCVSLLLPIANLLLWRPAKAINSCLRCSHLTIPAIDKHWMADHRYFLLCMVIRTPHPQLVNDFILSMKRWKLTETVQSLGMFLTSVYVVGPTSCRVQFLARTYRLFWSFFAWKELYFLLILKTHVVLQSFIGR